ncbi:MAG: GAF domain-containing protein, partial [Cyanobacteria bacterium J06600_6]
MVDSPTPMPQPSGNQGQTLLDTLASLSYRERDLDSYLHEITQAVSRLIGVEWSVVTCCDRQQYKVVASNIEISLQHNSFNLHGSLTGTVVETGKSLCVADTDLDHQYE